MQVEIESIDPRGSKGSRFQRVDTRINEKDGFGFQYAFLMRLVAPLRNGEVRVLDVTLRTFGAEREARLRPRATPLVQLALDFERASPRRGRCLFRDCLMIQ